MFDMNDENYIRGCKVDREEKIISGRGNSVYAGKEIGRGVTCPKKRRDFRCGLEWMKAGRY